MRPGDAGALTGTLHDVTARENAQAAAARLQALRMCVTRALATPTTLAETGRTELPVELFRVGRLKETGVR